MARNLRAEETHMLFDVVRHGAAGELPPLSVRLNLPGRHNVLNALAAIAVATELGVPDEKIAAALETRSEEHTSELQSRPHLVCRLLLEKKKQKHPLNFIPLLRHQSPHHIPFRTPSHTPDG